MSILSKRKLESWLAYISWRAPSASATMRKFATKPKTEARSVLVTKKVTVFVTLPCFLSVCGGEVKTNLFFIQLVHEGGKDVLSIFAVTYNNASKPSYGIKHLRAAI